MATFAVTYTYRHDSDDARTELRALHLEFLRALHAEGRLLASGRLGEGGDPGALLIIAGDTAGTETMSDIAALMDGDPFSEHRLLASRQVREWTIVFGSVGQRA